METIRPEQLKAINSPSGGQSPTFDSTTQQFNWVTASGTGSGTGASTFLALTDTPDSYASEAGKAPVVNTIETALEFVTVVDDAPVDGNLYGRKDASWVVVSGTESFLGLTDTPATYVGQAGKVPQVVVGETALAFVTISGLSQIFPDHCFEWFSFFKKDTGTWSHVGEVGTNRAYGNGWYQSTPADGDGAHIYTLLDSGTYDVAIAGKSGNNEGIQDWYLDDVLFSAGQDWYSAGNVEGVVFTGTVTISTPGLHKISVIINSKNASSSNYYWLLTAVQLNKQ